MSVDHCGGRRVAWISRFVWVRGGLDGARGLWSNGQSESRLEIRPAAFATAWSDGHRATSGRHIVVGEMCPQGAGGRPAVAPLLMRTVRGPTPRPRSPTPSSAAATPRFVGVRRRRQARRRVRHRRRWPTSRSGQSVASGSLRRRPAVLARRRGRASAPRTRSAGGDRWVWPRGRRADAARRSAASHRVPDRRRLPVGRRARGRYRWRRRVRVVPARPGARRHPRPRRRSGPRRRPRAPPCTPKFQLYDVSSRRPRPAKVIPRRASCSTCSASSISTATAARSSCSRCGFRRCGRSWSTGHRLGAAARARRRRHRLPAVAIGCRTSRSDCDHRSRRGVAYRARFIATMATYATYVCLSRCGPGDRRVQQRRGCPARLARRHEGRARGGRAREPSAILPAMQRRNVAKVGTEKVNYYKQESTSGAIKIGGTVGSSRFTSRRASTRRCGRRLVRAVHPRVRRRRRVGRGRPDPGVRRR